MGVYILSVMSKQNIKADTCVNIKKKLKKIYINNPIEFQEYSYDDREYKEVDFDIKNITFHKEKIFEEIDLLIEAIVCIFDSVDISIEVIGGYNDTESAITRYENNRETSYKSFNLFATKDTNLKSQPYKKINGIYVYQSFEHDGMGVIFPSS